MTALHVAGDIAAGVGFFFASIGLFGVCRWFYRHRNDGSALGGAGLDSRKLGGSMTAPPPDD